MLSNYKFSSMGNIQLQVVNEAPGKVSRFGIEDSSECYHRYSG
jgi:hypothetical protein